MTDVESIAIERATLDDIPAYRSVQSAGWRDAYPNDDRGVLTHLVEQYTASWLTPEALAESREYVKKFLDDPDHHFLYVAKDDGKIVGMTHSSHLDGKQHLEALYIDQQYYGTGLGHRMIEAALSHFDYTKPITLDAVDYNNRAIRFYEKHGFRKVPGSEHDYQTRHPELKLPSVTMIKEGNA